VANLEKWGFSMKLRIMFVVLLGVQIAQPAIAGATFKCEINGRVEFSDRRCQPVKQPAICAERESKDVPRASLQTRCPTSGSLDVGKPAAIASAPQAGSGDGWDVSGRLALNTVSGGTESRLRTAHTPPNDAISRASSGVRYMAR